MKKIVLVVGMGITLVLASAGSCVSNEPAVCATYQDANGEWREPTDGEPVDDDPCDLEIDHNKAKPTKANPKPRTTKK